MYSDYKSPYRRKKPSQQQLSTWFQDGGYLSRYDELHLVDGKMKKNFFISLSQRMRRLLKQMSRINNEPEIYRH
jgi:hypothetical protein